MADALKVLRATSAGFEGSEVQLSGRAEQGLSVRLKSGRSGVLPSHPNVVLLHGSDFSCKDGWLTFNPVLDASRRTEQGWYEGKATVSIAPSPNGGLAIDVRFTGGQRTNIYSYDSARISLPKLGTGTTLSDAIRWPAISEPESDTTEIAPPPEPKELLKVRRMLDSQVLGNVILGGLKVSGDAVLVTLKAPRNADVVRLEDRLRAASINYEMKVSPTWSNNVYHMELLVWPAGTNTSRASRPSAHRVQQEMLKMRHPLVDVQRVDEVGDGYVATLNIVGPATVESIVARMKANTDMFTDIHLINESVRVDAPKVRVAQLRLRVR